MTQFEGKITLALPLTTLRKIYIFLRTHLTNNAIGAITQQHILGGKPSGNPLSIVTNVNLYAMDSLSIRYKFNLDKCITFTRNQWVIKAAQVASLSPHPAPDEAIFDVAFILHKFIQGGILQAACRRRRVL